MTKKFTRALLLGAVSYLVLSIDLSSPVFAQSTPLPAVTVDAPVRQTARSVAPSRRTSASRAAARRTPFVPYVTPSTGIIGALPAAYAGGQVATGGQVGLLGNRGVMDTPFNQTSYTRELIENNQARTLPDVLISDPSVGSALPRNIGREQPVIRGFLLGNTSVGFNGYFGLIGNNNFNVLDAVEGVEVIKGLNALLNGQSPDNSIGGAINLILKRARNEPIAELITSFASRGQGGVHLDVGQRYGEHKEFGVRYNGTYRDGSTEVDNQSLQLQSTIAANACAFRPISSTIRRGVTVSAPETPLAQACDGCLTRRRARISGIRSGPVSRAGTAPRCFRPRWMSPTG